MKSKFNHLPGDSPVKFSSLTALQSKGMPHGRFSVVVNHGRFECFLQSSEKDRLFILLSGARDPNRAPLPVFDRWSWADCFPGHVLNISDPTLYLSEEDLRIGWYVGTQHLNWTEALANLVITASNLLKIPLENVTAYGSSAGGFASLMLGVRLREITSIAINPQTNVLNYSKKHVKMFLDRAYGKDKDNLNNVDLRRLSVMKNIAVNPAIRGLIVQNKMDTHHYNIHFAELCEAMGLEASGSYRGGAFQAVTYSGEESHGPEPKDMVPMILDMALKVTSP